jgi:hypothetical protein
MRNLLAIAVVACWASTAGATTVFGIELGKPVNLPLCSQIGDSVDAIATGPSKVCREPDNQLSDAPFRRGMVKFPKDQSPSIIVSEAVSTYFLKDNVVAVEASTVGYAHAAAVVSALTDKFGPPAMSRIGMQVVDGMTVAAQHAIWRSQGVTVDYQSVADSSVDYGELMITTPEYDSARGAADIKKVGKRTPL